MSANQHRQQGQTNPTPPQATRHPDRMMSTQTFSSLFMKNAENVHPIIKHRFYTPGFRRSLALLSLSAAEHVELEPVLIHYTLSPGQIPVEGLRDSCSNQWGGVFSILPQPCPLLPSILCWRSCRPHPRLGILRPWYWQGRGGSPRRHDALLQQAKVSILPVTR